LTGGKGSDRRKNQNLAAFGGTFLTGLPRLTRFSYFLYILNITSILSKKWDFLYYELRGFAPIPCVRQYIIIPIKFYYFNRL